MTFQPKHLFVPVDADIHGDRELAHKLVDDAADLARNLGAKLTLAHVAVAPVPQIAAAELRSTATAAHAMVGVLEGRNNAAHAELDKLVERAKTRLSASGAGADVESMFIVQGGTIPEVLVDVAKKLAADLIVMATHGRKGLQRLVLGSVAEKTAHLSSIPVLLLPAH